jgi:hypothetical protein
MAMSLPLGAIGDIWIVSASAERERGSKTNPEFFVYRLFTFSNGLSIEKVSSFA